MQKVLIANRGEIAVRVARGCAAHGVASVAVHADQDADALHVQVADEAWALPGTTAARTYLDAGAVLSAARASGADAVHPGYGFLSEDAGFARAVRDAGLIWVGPPPEAMELLGDKVSARRIAASVGAPMVAGTAGPVEDAAAVLAFADEHGLPVAIKAAFGGGGRGLRVARRREEVVELFEAARREAVSAFGRGEVFVERFLDRPRHVEVQVLADDHGTTVALGTRDCSLQRRHQKLVEEAPAPFLPPGVHERLLTAARDVCAAAGYRGAGTVEFLLGDGGALSFLEVNTRLQVEHPVTELTTGLDLVRQQLRIADGLPLEVTRTPAPVGHAIEFRLNAEDPGRGFLPSPGPVTVFDVPGGPGVRVDAGVRAGGAVPAEFDSLLAKLVVHGRDRDEALRRARSALAEFRVEGVATVLPFHRRVVDDPAFAAGTADGFAVHTGWIESGCDWLPELAVDAPATGPSAPLRRVWVEIDGRRVRLGLPADLLTAAPVAAGPPTQTVADGDLVSPGTGTLTRWLVEDGAPVERGRAVAVVEAMKMESPLTAPTTGVLRRRVAAGSAVEAGRVLGTVARPPGA